MPIFLGLLATGLGGMFIGSQVDDAIDKNTQPVGGGLTQSMPYYVSVPLIIAAGTAAFFVTKKLIKKM